MKVRKDIFLGIFLLYLLFFDSLLSIDCFGDLFITNGQRGGISGLVHQWDWGLFIIPTFYSGHG